MNAATLAPDMNQEIARLFHRKRLIAFGIPAAILAYLVYIFISFNVVDLVRNASVENANTLVSDSYSYKTHVTRDNRSGEISIAIEGERKGRYEQGVSPDWVNLGETTVIELDPDNIITFGPNYVSYNVPNYGEIYAEPGSNGVNAVLPEGPLPEWINSSKNRLAVTTPAGRLTVTRNRTEVFRYFLGWELFFFTLDSPYHGLGAGALMQKALSGEASQIWSDFWNNKMWRHGDVAWAMFETMLMAFLGTFGAAIVALPIAFLAAKNFTPLRSMRFAARRLFDLLRGVDGLIWTVVLSRAFGPGPLTGSLAILLTDTGTFGKMFSEALENVDENQTEGIRSTGANAPQRVRFGVLPQIVPILLSQVLYYLESNTRSATIIGAITGGGIGLLLTQAIITQKDWEEVTYYIVLIVLMVMFMDSFSGWLRRKLIKGSAEN
ncbi:phosphonate ABC transporter, permease protein PhnE [Falsihalocynthiibacter sp. SS001]|uniref:phosphonate ABC transporter, permease protein PhnE n=1 Tax=Falsihalocynthiibacter sp. SS001 TaxID=3349698 RepID=UPI0036D232C9